MPSGLSSQEKVGSVRKRVRVMELTIDWSVNDERVDVAWSKLCEKMALAASMGIFLTTGGPGRMTAERLPRDSVTVAGDICNWGSHTRVVTRQGSLRVLLRVEFAIGGMK